MNISKKLTCLLAVLFFSFTPNIAQDLTSAEYSKLFRTPDPQERIDLLNKFRADYPTSSFFSNSLSQTFSAYVQLGNADSALIYAHKYILTVPEVSKEAPYSNFAFQLAEKGIALDSAESFVNRAVQLARKNNSRRLNAILNTQASVLFKRGKVNEAVTVQEEALAGNDSNPEYLMNYGIYLFELGNKEEAVKNMGFSALFGRNPKSIEYLNNWLTDQNERTKVADQTANNFFAAGETPVMKSIAAAFFASLKVNLDKALKLASEASSVLNDESSADEIVMIKQNLALVYFAKDKYNESLEELKKAEKFTAPFNSDFYLLKGKIYQKMNNDEEALKSYLTGNLFGGNFEVAEAIKTISQKLNLTQVQLDEKSEAIKTEFRNFEFEGHFKTESKKVVVAELFTGAECPPCVAADEAFDKLAEHYSKENLLILEYHLHIPGPDPMTNPDTFSKYQFYGANFGTPTVFIEGVEKLVGGGPDFVASSRANIYQHSINKYYKENPKLQISGKTTTKEDIINIDVTLKSENQIENSIVQIALLEKSVDYTGANGVSKHIYVVRSLINGAEGVLLNLEKGSQTISQIIDVYEIERRIKEYLDNPENHPSWRKGTKFTGWRARPDNINRTNLGIAVYVQDVTSKKIMQAKYFDIK
jgi:tetratricopeptide (TPR) repeat protein